MTISLVSISNINHKLVEFSINKSCETKKFDEVLVFSDKPLAKIKYDYTYHNIDEVMSKLATMPWEKNSFTLDVYNDFLMKGLVNFINTDHIISIHYDGFCVNADEWTDEYLEYDYVGSPTHKKWFPLANSLHDHGVYDQYPNGWYTGGGGFSLRSKKLLQALQDPEITPFISNTNFQRCEDWCIAVKHKELLIKKYGIKFAPLDLSLQFSTELLTGLNFSFGFHGWENVPLFLSQDETIFFIENIDKDTIFEPSILYSRFLFNCQARNYIKAIERFLEVAREKKHLSTYRR